MFLVRVVTGQGCVGLVVESLGREVRGVKHARANAAGEHEFIRMGRPRGQIPHRIVRPRNARDQVGVVPDDHEIIVQRRCVLVDRKNRAGASRAIVGAFVAFAIVEGALEIDITILAGRVVVCSACQRVTDDGRLVVCQEGWIIPRHGANHFKNARVDRRIWQLPVGVQELKDGKARLAGAELLAAGVHVRAVDGSECQVQEPIRESCHCRLQVNRRVGDVDAGVRWPECPRYGRGHADCVGDIGRERPFQNRRDGPHRIELVLGDAPHEGVQSVAVLVFLRQDSDVRLRDGAAVGARRVLSIRGNGDCPTDEIVVVLIDPIGCEARQEDVPLVWGRQQNVTNLDRVLIDARYHDAAGGIDADRTTGLGAARSDSLAPVPGAGACVKLGKKNIGVARGEQLLRAETDRDCKVAGDVNAPQRIHGDGIREPIAAAGLGVPE